MPRPLFDGKLEPLTWSMGFIEATPTFVANTLLEWRERIGTQPRLRSIRGDLRECLDHLPPLTLPPTRELLIANGNWTAYLTNGYRGTDAVAPVSQLALLCQTTAVGIHWHAEPVEVASIGFALFGPVKTDFSNHVRAVQLSRDGRKWHWVVTGTPQVYEALSSYEAPRVTDRFTAELLNDYLLALGIDAFDEEAYGPDGILVESRRPPVRSRSLAIARRDIGL
jgi:hypothetical protein